MVLKIAFSPCPNDTFIFDALVNGKIDTEGIRFETLLEDVETLNNNAIQEKYDITKISYGVYHKIADSYQILDSGSALGSGVGPLLITKDDPEKIIVDPQPVAIPGENTTAHFLFSSAYPEAKKKIFMRYDEIEDFVLSGKGLGVIIHENRFTYADKGLHLITDLGSFWETTTRNPIPLGGIVVKRSIDKQLQQTINRLIRNSIGFAFSNYPELSDYVKLHAQEMNNEVMRKHVDLYVNDFSLSLGHAGKSAIMKMMEFFQKNNQAKELDYFAG